MKLVIALILFITSSSICAQNVIIVRHAEKQQGPNPMLTEHGTQRAERLVTLLKGYDIKAVFSTSYNRTQLTATPISKVRNLPIDDYDPRDQQGLITKIRNIKGDVFIVGHSNTVPELVYLLSGKKIILDENTYDALLVINKQNIIWQSSN